MSGDDTLVVICGLPVNRLETVIELLRSSKLPLAEEEAQNEEASDRGSKNDDDGDNSGTSTF